jgi:hypothetical protein
LHALTFVDVGLPLVVGWLTGGEGVVCDQCDLLALAIDVCHGVTVKVEIFARNLISLFSLMALTSEN